MKRKVLAVLFATALTAGMLSGCGSERHSQVSRAAFRSTVDGKATDLYTLRNARGLEMTVTNFGGRVVELWVPDRDGNFADIVLGHDNLGAYVDQTGERFLGATIGRYGNRIAAGRFTLDGKEYTLPLNDGPNSLHGGAKGFDMVVWDVVEVTPQKIVLACLSPDGDQGYPGNLKVTMTYELTDDNSFVITHEAATDRRTVVNLTHHSFFNLHGAGGPPINDHELMIAADFFTPVDSTLIPTGRLMPVEGTPMDFRRPAPIGSRLDADFEQLRHGRRSQQGNFFRAIHGHLVLLLFRCVPHGCQLLKSPLLEVRGEVMDAVLPVRQSGEEFLRRLRRRRVQGLL